MLGDKALRYVIKNYKFDKVLDVGSGLGVQAKAFREAGKEVVEIDIKKYHIDYMDYETKPVEFIWASHVLEHQRNVGMFLDKIYKDLLDGGLLVITVPPSKPTIVGGHLSIWNAGLLLYNLVMAGFDCSEAKVYKYGYNISVIVEKHSIELPKLNYDRGDINKLAMFFPNNIKKDSFDGRMDVLGL